VNTFIIRDFPKGKPVATVEFPAELEGHGVAHYVITEQPPLRRGMAPRFFVYLVLDADGRCLNDNLPVATRPTLEGAVARAKVAL
jgi:hypothetical protein